MEEMDETLSAENVVLMGVSVSPLFFTPVFYGFLSTGTEAVVYKVLSGQAVWRNQFAGTPGPQMKGSIKNKFFENLENVIPAQLAKVKVILTLALSGYGLLAALPVERARMGSKFEAYIFESGTGRNGLGVGL